MLFGIGESDGKRLAGSLGPLGRYGSAGCEVRCSSNLSGGQGFCHVRLHGLGKASTRSVGTSRLSYLDTSIGLLEKGGGPARKRGCPNCAVDPYEAENPL